MKKILAVLLVLCMVATMSVPALAAETKTTDITYSASANGGSDSATWTVTVPSSLVAGQSGEVKAEGIWSPSDILSVTADKKVNMYLDGDKNADYATVPVTYNAIALSGSYASEVTKTEAVTVDAENTMSAIKFGAWQGVLTFYISLDADPNYVSGNIGKEPIPEGAVMIATAEELVAFAATTTDADTYVALTDDIDLANVTWTSIANFAGTFNGQGYTISNLENASLFGAVSGTVKNLNFDGATRTASSYNGAGATFIGTVAGNAVVDGCTVSNVTLTWADTVTDCGDGVSGVIGGVDAGATVQNCKFNDITITAYGKLKRTGAVFSSISGTVSNCTADGVNIITTGKGYTQQAGGFVGTVNNGANISNCDVDNVTITTEYAALKTGGFAGLTYGGTITNCDMDNVTMSVGKTYSEFAGFIGQHDSRSNNTRLTVSGCDITGLNMTVKGYYQDWACGSAGFISGVSGGADITNCSVAGTINAAEATVAVGGFVGSGGSSTDSIANITGCVANVDITVGDNVGGAFIGRAGRCMGADDDKIYFNFVDCEANGTVTATGTGTAGAFYGAIFGTQNTFSDCKVNGADFNG